MNRGKHKPTFLVAAAIALACATWSGGAISAPAIYVRSDYSTEDGLFAPTQVDGTATAGTSTSQLDGGNFATTTADADADSVGIGLATTLPDGSPVSASAVARIEDDWEPCGAALCATNIHPAEVILVMHFDGTLSPAWLDANAISGEENAFSGSFHVAGSTIDFAWDGSQLAGTFCYRGDTARCSPFTFASTTLADGSLSFDDDVSFTGSLFGNVGFTTELTLSAGWDTSKQPSALSFVHTLGFEIVSTDPTLYWVSDTGQVTPVSGVSAVPEPGTLPLVSLGLFLLAPLARNGRRRGQAARTLA